jgi:outer membrane protein TolC
MLSTLRCVVLGTALAALPGCLGAGGAEIRRQATELDALEAVPPPAEAPFAGAAALERGALVDEVLRRNPTIAAARYAWRAALARYPQETALEDPMFSYGLGPRTFSSDEAPQIGQRFELSQAFPFPGKRALRGATAIAEADAAAHDYRAVRVRLAAMASALYDDYWLVGRAEQINREHLELVRELREIATTRYESGSAEQQDPLRAEVEETELLHQEVSLATARRVAMQQLAALLHERDGSALPPPPAALSVAAVEDPGPGADPPLAERPELQAADARIRAREAGEDLALREYFPDVRVMAVYDRFWEISDLQPMVGFELNLPLQLARRRAALDQARAELGMARSERDKMQDEIATEVLTARERLAEARHLLELIRDRMVPAARDQLAAARAGYEAGRVDFADVIEAERALRNATLASDEGLAATSRRAAELAAALGRVPGKDSGAGAPHEGGSHHE